MNSNIAYVLIVLILVVGISSCTVLQAKFYTDSEIAKYKLFEEYSPLERCYDDCGSMVRVETCKESCRTAFGEP